MLFNAVIEITYQNKREAMANKEKGVSMNESQNAGAGGKQDVPGKPGAPNMADTPKSSSDSVKKRVDGSVERPTEVHAKNVDAERHPEEQLEQKKV
jgi:hypothetical protein